MEEVINVSVEETVNDVCYLQEQIFNLTEEGVVNLASYIAKSRFSTSPNRLSHVVQALLMGANYRPFVINLYVGLTKTILHYCSSKNCLSELPEMILDRFFYTIRKNRVIDEECGKFRFIRQCYVKSIFSNINLILKIREFFNLNKKFSDSICLLFCYFAGDLYKSDKIFYEEIFSFCQQKYPNEIYLPFLNQIPQYQHNNWVEWSDLSNRYTNSNYLSDVLRHDDLIRLKTLINNEEIRVNDRIDPNIFESHYILQNHPTLIQFCSYFGSLTCYLYLKSLKADINLLDDKKRNIIHFAIAGWHPQIIDSLQSDGYNCEGALKVSAEFHISKFFVWIKDKSNDVKNIINNSKDAFFAAVKSNNFVVVQMYVNNEFDLNVNDEFGNTPLHIAALSFNDKMIEYLLSKNNKIKPNLHNKDGDAPIHIVVKMNDEFALKMFCDSNEIVDFNNKNANGKTPLFLAVMNNNIDIVRLLLSIESVDVNICDDSGMTPLHWAVSYQYLDIIHELLENEKIDISIKDENEETPKMLAAMSENNEIIKCFCEKTGEDPNTFAIKSPEIIFDYSSDTEYEHESDSESNDINDSD